MEDSTVSVGRPSPHRLQLVRWGQFTLLQEPHVQDPAGCCTGAVPEVTVCVGCGGEGRGEVAKRECSSETVWSGESHNLNTKNKQKM